jgi:hypothetical protein
MYGDRCEEVARTSRVIVVTVWCQSKVWLCYVCDYMQDMVFVCLASICSGAAVRGCQRQQSAGRSAAWQCD